MSDCIVERITPAGQTLWICQGDLTLEKVDAIVNAANAHLAHGGGIAGAIVRRGGDEIQAESDAWVRTHGPVTHTEPALTGGGGLPCRHVIHAVGPQWGEGDEVAKLEAAVQGVLQMAGEHQLTRIALPAISTGIFGFPKKLAAETILAAISQYFDANPHKHPREVRVVLFDDESLEVFLAEFSRRWPDDLALS